MTICIAIKVGTTVYLAADSMVTGENPQHSVSATGEKLHNTSRGPISDNCWKVYPIGSQQLMTYAGVERTGDAIADILASGYDTEAYPLQQMKTAIDSVKPMPEDRAVDVLWACPWGEDTKLIYFNFDTDDILEIPSGSFKIIGSMPPANRKALNTLIQKTLKNLPEQEDPEGLITVLLGVLMADARYFNLVEHGIGGAFCGGYVTPQGRGWQPDILFQPYKKTANGSVFNGMQIHTLVRDNNFVIGTGAQGKTIRAWQRDDWDNEWLDFLTNYPDYGRTDYIVFYSTDNDFHRSVIVKMQKHKSSKYMNIEAHGIKMRLTWLPIIESYLMMKKHGFAYIPFDQNQNASENLGDSIAEVLYGNLPPQIARRVFDKMLQRIRFDTKYSEEEE